MLNEYPEESFTGIECPQKHSSESCQQNEHKWHVNRQESKALLSINTSNIGAQFEHSLHKPCKCLAQETGISKDHKDHSIIIESTTTL